MNSLKSMYGQAVRYLGDELPSQLQSAFHGAVLTGIEGVMGCLPGKLAAGEGGKYCDYTSAYLDRNTQVVYNMDNQKDWLVWAGMAGLTTSFMLGAAPLAVAATGVGVAVGAANVVGAAKALHYRLTRPDEVVAAPSAPIP